MKSNIILQVGKKIQQVRKDCGYTQEKLATLTNIDYKYLQKIEGKNPPALRIDTIERLARALKIPPSKLLEP